MDIQKIKELALANGFKLKEQASGNMDLNAYVYDFANAIEQEAKAKAVPEEKGRSDFEIIDQTIELVDLIASSNRFQRDKSKPFPFESNNPRNIEWWRLACKIQELLTYTDPDNCDFDEYKTMIKAREQGHD